MSTRRNVLKAGAAAGAVAAIGGPRLLRSRRAEAATINPSSIPKFVTPLFILPAMPPVSLSGDHDEFHVAQRRIAAQILPAGFPKTLVNGYGNPSVRSSFHAPGFTIETKVNRQARVTWDNQLVDSSGNFLPHLLTVDPTIHWANPPGGVNGRDSTPSFTSQPPPYVGPQPMVVHLHGIHDFEESDGLPETWWLPVAKNIPKGFATGGTFYEQYKQEALDRWGVRWAPGTSTSVYPNDQRAGTLWYHDHVLGMTRLDDHTGLIGFYNISGGVGDLPDQLPGPRPLPGDPPGKRYYDIFLALQDKSFNADGSIFFPDHSDLTGPYIPNTDIPPYWNSSFQGTVSTVNGNSWPILEVEPRRYRFRFLDADNFRTYGLKIVTPANVTARPAPIAVPTWAIAGDGGGVQQKAIPLHELQPPHDRVFMVTSERAEVVADFTGFKPGDEFILINEIVGNNDANHDPNAITNVGQIMKFKVIPLQSRDTSRPPDQIEGPPRRDFGPSARTRKISMNVRHNQNTTAAEVKRFQMGFIDDAGVNHLELWSDPISQKVPFGSVETWEIHNRAGDGGVVGTGDSQLGGGHAFHIHLVEFQLLNRQALDTNGNPTGDPIPIEAWEHGEKDTAFAPANMVTRFKTIFDRKSQYIYHCHFIDHEDHEMMRFWQVV
jgi:spore coat protein A, manganese oxidase